MKYIYSATDNKFFPLQLKNEYIVAGSWPDNGILVDENTFSTFINPPPGKIWVPGNDGLPTWADIPPLTQKEQIASAQQQRQNLLINADYVIADWRTELALGELSDADKAKLSAWMAYKREVKAVDPANPVWPEPPEV